MRANVLLASLRGTAMPDDPNVTLDPNAEPESGSSASADQPPCLSQDPRKLAAKARREQAADLACRRDLDPDDNADNGDEDRFEFPPDPPEPPSRDQRSFVAQHTKGMGHNKLGEVSPRSQYRTLLAAVQPTVPPQPPSAFEAIPRGPASVEINRPLRRYVNPQAGVAFTLEAPDAPQSAVFARGTLKAEPFPPAPTLDSKQAAAELAETYEMAMLRDVPFTEFHAGTADPRVLEAAASLSAFADFRGPKITTGGPIRVTAQTLLRGGVYFDEQDSQFNGGELVGPPVSQLLLIGTAIEPGQGLTRQFSAETRTTDGEGKTVIPPGTSNGLSVPRTAGRIQFGAITIDQRVRAIREGIDFMVERNEWLGIQNGFEPQRRNEFVPNQTDPDGGLRFIYSPRQLADFVHFDQTYQTYYAAAFLLLGMAGRAEQFGVPLFGIGNPYNLPSERGVPGSANQQGFSTFAQGHLLALLAQADQRALHAVWYQKWFVQRRLRPEAMAGWVDNIQRGLTKRERYGISEDLLKTDHGQKLLTRVAEFNASRGSQEKSFLLAQVFPEGSPMHPSYGAGHAVEAGSGATILKAFFNEDLIISDPRTGPIQEPVPGRVTRQPALIASPDGRSLIQYSGAGSEASLPLWQEVNKLAANIAIGRNMAGVHFRTDYTASLRQGEYEAVGLLQEQAANFNENQFFQVTLFDLRIIRIGRNGITVVGQRGVPRPSEVGT